MTTRAIAVLLVLLLAGCSTGSEGTRPRPTASALPDEDDEAARMRAIFADAAVVEWEAKVTARNDRPYYRMSGRHAVDGSGSEMTMFIGRRREDRITFLGPRTVVQSTSWPDHLENCWIDITSTPRFHGDLPADPDPLATITAMRPVRLVGDGVAGGVPVEVAGALFPRRVFAGLDLEGEADEVTVVLREEEGAVDYMIAIEWILTASEKVKAVERLMRLPSAVLHVTVRPAQDESPIVPPPGGLTLRPGERPSRPCPTSV